SRAPGRADLDEERELAAREARPGHTHAWLAAARLLAYACTSFSLAPIHLAPHRSARAAARIRAGRDSEAGSSVPACRALRFRARRGRHSREPARRTRARPDARRVLRNGAARGRAERRPPDAESAPEPARRGHVERV